MVGEKELKEKAAVLQGELSRTLEATVNAEMFMKVVRKYTSFEELTPTLLRKFVEKIVIYESEALDGKRRVRKLRRQEIEIYYSFIGKVEMPDLSGSQSDRERQNFLHFFFFFISHEQKRRAAGGA